MTSSRCAGLPVAGLTVWQLTSKQTHAFPCDTAGLYVLERHRYALAEDRESIAETGGHVACG
jgi:glutamine cyclotransferase